jgi:hypothetical protein
MAFDQAVLAALVAAVPDQAEVYAADLAAVAAPPDAPPPAPEKTPEETALDGLAYHVFNTLRGVEDAVPTKVVDGVVVDWASFEDIRGIVAKGGF